MKKILFSLVVLLSANAVADDYKARVITGTDKPVQCISSIQVTRIDGKEVKVNKLAFDIEPGMHSISGRAIFVGSNCPALRGNDQHQVPDLIFVFESGKTYYLGLDHSARNRKGWHYTVWKIED
jgi:hypothetical protein